MNGYGMVTLTRALCMAVCLGVQESEACFEVEVDHQALQHTYMNYTAEPIRPNTPDPRALSGAAVNRVHPNKTPMKDMPARPFTR